MFECKYKFELEDCIISAKHVYNSQKRKQDKVIAILIPILLVAMVAMLIFDIASGNSVVWDIILLAALIILQVTYLIIPIVLVKSQKKAFQKQKLDEVDYVYITIDGNTCKEALYKNNEIVSNSIHSLKFLTSYLEDDTRLILIFNKIEYVCLRKNAIEGSLNKLKEHLNKTMSKQLKK